MTPYRLAHLSDPHLVDWRELSPAEFLGKRATGWANFRFRRGAVHRLEVLEAVLDDLVAAAPDHVVVTGDLSSLGFGQELAGFARLLEARGLGPERVSLVPGNHDAYTRRVWREAVFVRHLGPYMTSDLHGGVPAFPFCRLRGPVAVLGLSSAVARPVFLAGGLVGDEQAGRLAALLGHREVQARLPVVLVHHPLPVHPSFAKELQAGLLDRARVLTALREGLDGRDAVVLSGHWHERRRVRLELPGRVWSLQAQSASHGGGGPERMAGYQLLEIREQPGRGPALAAVELRRFEPSSGRVVAAGRED